jgi:MFS family permease
VTPVEAAIDRVSRAIGSYRPAAMPVLTRSLYRREIVASFFLPVMLGAAEGGVVSVIAKNAFDGVVADRWLNIAVAVLSGSPAFANVTSFLWANLSHGRHKIRFLVGLQVAASILVALIALSPRNATGLMLLTIGAVGARICWAGVVTIRTTVWRANYPRHVRAQMAGRVATVLAVMLTAVALALGWAMRLNDQSFHLIYPVAAGFGLVGAIIYSRMRMRGHRALLAAERRGAEERRIVNMLHMWHILREDRAFRRYMICMFLLGIGNLSVMAPLVIMLRDIFEYEYLMGMLITAAIPFLMLALFVPFWAKLFDRMHIIRFRAIHCWVFVATNVMILIAGLTVQPVLLFAAAVLRGFAFGGGVLGWNLGHHDFASRERSGEYMGVHVTLTGVRGLIGPFVAVVLYEWFDALRPGAGVWVFAACVALSVAGSIGFVLLDRSFRRHAEEPTAVNEPPV